MNYNGNRTYEKEHAPTCTHEHVEDIVDVHLTQSSIQRGSSQVGVAAAVKVIKTIVYLGPW